MISKVKIFLALLVVLQISCRKNDAGVLDINYQSYISVPAGTGTWITYSFTTADIPGRYEQELANHNISPAAVQAIQSRRMLLTVTYPVGETFGFLNSVHIYIGADGMPETEIARLDGITDSAGEYLEPEPSGAAFDEYIRKDNFRLRLEVVTDEFLPGQVDIRIDWTVRVTAS